MGVKNTVVTKLIAALLNYLIDNISPQLREEIVAAVKRLDEKAKTTKNQVDDMFVMFLKAILNID